MRIELRSFATCIVVLAIVLATRGEARAGPVRGDDALVELTAVGGVMAFPQEMDVNGNERLSPAALGGVRVAWPARWPVALELCANRGFSRTAAPADRATGNWQAGGDVRLRIQAGPRTTFAALFGAAHFEINPKGLDGDGRFAADWGGRAQYHVSDRLRAGFEVREYLVQGTGGGGLADFSPNVSAHVVTALALALSVPLGGTLR